MAKSKDSNGRVPMLSIEDSKTAAEKAGIPAMLAPLSVFRMLLQHPPLAKALSQMLATLLWEPKLEPRLRELVILRLGWVTGSVYEWTQHWRIARGLGMSEEECLGVRDWKAYGGYGRAERAVLAATDDTLEIGAIRDETWAECEASLGGVAERLELVVAIGNWRLFSSMLRSLEVPLEDGLEPWPPDGKRPIPS
jgi:alkylhydroperoxidase family enzyme